MFQDIGGKIKAASQALCWLGMIAWLLYGAVGILQQSDLVLWYAGIIFLGCFGSWLASLFAYGFGQLIQNSDIIASHYLEEE